MRTPTVRPSAASVRRVPCRLGRNHRALAGRRLDDAAYFGRAVTHLAVGATTLATVAQAIDLFARLEHAPTPSDPLRVVYRAAADTAVTLHCPAEPSNVTVDGSALSFSWSAGQLSLSLPAGQHQVLLEP